VSWLRTDDGFTSHPKFEGWKPAEKWAFLELMHYCARYRTQGRIPNDLTLLPRSVTPKLLERAATSGWIDRRNGSAWIHDWEVYNPRDATAADRMRRHRSRHREGTNKTGGDDDDSSRARNAGRNAMRNSAVTESQRPPARARARAGSRPVPSPGGPEAVGSAVRATADYTSWPDTSDPVTRLLLRLPDADPGTDGVLRSFVGRVPEHAFDYTREEVSRVRAGAALAVTILRRIERDGRP
jgi:hypothetical protein